MRVEMHTNGIELTKKLRDHIETRLRFGLARFGDRVRSVRVRLTDVNGPRGGEDVLCRIHATLAPGGELVLRESHHDVFAAVARATSRASHSLARRVGRLHSRRKGRN